MPGAAPDVRGRVSAWAELTLLLGALVVVVVAVAWLVSGIRSGRP